METIIRRLVRINRVGGEKGWRVVEETLFEVWGLEDDLPVLHVLSLELQDGALRKKRGDEKRNEVPCLQPTRPADVDRLQRGLLDGLHEDELKGLGRKRGRRRKVQDFTELGHVPGGMRVARRRRRRRRQREERRRRRWCSMLSGPAVATRSCRFRDDEDVRLRGKGVDGLLDGVLVQLLVERNHGEGCQLVPEGAEARRGVTGRHEAGEEEDVITGERSDVLQELELLGVKDIDLFLVGEASAAGRRGELLGDGMRDEGERGGEGGGRGCVSSLVRGASGDRGLGVVRHRVTFTARRRITPRSSSRPFTVPFFLAFGSL